MYFASQSRTVIVTDGAYPHTELAGSCTHYEAVKQLQLCARGQQSSVEAEQRRFLPTPRGDTISDLRQQSGVSHSRAESHTEQAGAAACLLAVLAITTTV